MPSKLVGDILPITADEVVTNLEDEAGSSAYLFLGPKRGRAWTFAKQLIAAGGIAKLHLYHVKDREEVERWIGNKRPVAVILGFEARAHALVDKATSESIIQLVTLIAKTQEESKQ